MKHVLVTFTSVMLLGYLAYFAQATLIGVAGPNSSAGTGPAIIPAPTDVLDDLVTNTGMQGFDEAQGVVTTVAHSLDGGVIVPMGTTVDSHMIFLNSEGSSLLSHEDVTWTFSGLIIGVMSDPGGALEAASTFELGNPATNYTVGAGAAPFAARGLEGGDALSGGGAGTNFLTVSMQVTEPGDWIRVVTESTIPGTPIPEPGTVLLLGSGIIGLGIWRWKKVS